MGREREEFDWRLLDPKDWPDNERQALAEIKDDEGFIPSADGRSMIGYYDDKGYLTEGYGSLVVGAERREDLAGKHVPEMRMSFEEGEVLLGKDYIKHRNYATKAPGWNNASPIQKRALTNLTFNMGEDWWLPKKRTGKVSLAVGEGGRNMYVDSSGKKVKGGWPAFATAAAAGDYDLAADELVRSGWYTDVKKRGPRVVEMFRPPVEEDEFRVASLSGMWAGGLVGRSRYT